MLPQMHGRVQLHIHCHITRKHDPENSRKLFSLCCSPDCMALGVDISSFHLSALSPSSFYLRVLSVSLKIFLTFYF